MIAIYPYETQAVRDLAWAVFSPSMLHIATLPNTRGGVLDCHFELTTGRRLWLEQLDRDAQPLIRHLEQRRSHRLGLYFEQLWHFFLDADPEVELVAHNLPVRDEERTLGEFDVIYFCHRRNRHVHLELAVKYYLGVNNQKAGPIWLGPDEGDNLDNKLVHLLQRQICLSDRPAASARLRALDIESVEREIALKGYLFQPMRDPLESPQSYNTACQYNRWCRPGTLEDLPGYSNASHFMRLQKMQWLSGAQANPNSKLISPGKLKAEAEAMISENPYPALIAAMDTLGNEISRFFVTPEYWPISL